MKACDSSFTTAASLFATPGKDWKTIKWCRIQDSDPHGRGKSVIFVGESPAQITAVYKPRNLALEKWITAMLKELSQADPRTRNWFLPVYLLDNDHGWMSHVRHRCVHDREGVERYYFRAGFLLGLCFFF